ncbi:MAG: hypothetical protein ACO3LZ_03495, partial [Candidatus Nanopelagicales bacterium]
VRRDMDAALARAALDRLDAVIDEADNDGETIPQDVIEQLRRDAEVRIDRTRNSEEAATTRELATKRLIEIARAMVQAEQEELIRLRDEEGFPDAIIRPKLRDLDVRLQALNT